MISFELLHVDKYLSSGIYWILNVIIYKDHRNEEVKENVDGTRLL